MGSTPLALFCDQLAIHRMIEVKEEYRKLDIKLILNVGYSPQFNPIEAVFSKVKSIFNRARLNALVRKVEFKMDLEITLAFKRVTNAHCASCCRKSHHLL